MAEEIYCTKQSNPSKIYSHFLYKALIASIFLVILPLFPSQAPEFINQTLNTRGWEFLHLLFVGIAVSYGLFSRRNEEREKENNNSLRFDNAQSYLSRFLQVSSVFDDEADSPPRAADEDKVQTWSNQYFRNEPVIVVAEGQPFADDEQKGSSSRISEKPLLLPIRSLKSRIVDADSNQNTKESAGISRSISRSTSSSSSKRFSSDFSSKGGDFERLDRDQFEDKLEEKTVLPSPIPWRSRSGRMEMKEEANNPSMFTLPPSMEEPEFNWSSRSQFSRSTRPSYTTSSPKLSPSPSTSSPKKNSPSPSPSFSFEAHGKWSEDFVRKKSIYRSPPPPPPPPPSIPVIQRSSSLMKPWSSAIDDEEFNKKDFNRSFTREPKDLNKVGNVAVPKSVRTTRSNDPLAGAWMEKGLDDGFNNKTPGFDQLSFNKVDRLNRESVTSMPQPTFREFPNQEKGQLVEKLVMDCDEESETEEEDEIEEISAVSSTVASTKNEEANCSAENDGGPDVDKKADEFIAKFREQIRLQRIESIRRSSAKISRKAPMQS